MKKMNPAAKSMIGLLASIVLLVGMWSVIGYIAFPKPSVPQRLTGFVAENESVLVQVAENAMDETVNPGITTSVEVMKILGEEHIASVTAYEQGAAFNIESDETPAGGCLRILYLPDGQYAFRTDSPEEWKSAALKEANALRWENASGGYVNVTRLTDRFFLEEVLMK